VPSLPLAKKRPSKRRTRISEKNVYNSFTRTFNKLMPYLLT